MRVRLSQCTLHIPMHIIFCNNFNRKNSFYCGKSWIPHCNPDQTTLQLDILSIDICNLLTQWHDILKVSKHMVKKVQQFQDVFQGIAKVFKSIEIDGSMHKCLSFCVISLCHFSIWHSMCYLVQNTTIKKRLKSAFVIKVIAQSNILIHRRKNGLLKVSYVKAH